MCCLQCLGNPFCLFGSCFCILLLLVPLLLLLSPIFGTIMLVLLVPYLIVLTINSILAAEVHSPQECAAILYNHARANRGQSEGLPDKLRGVFWMSDNMAPEMLATFEGGTWDESRKMLNVKSGATYNWTYSADIVGTVYWFFLRVSYMFCSELHINFDDEIKEATMPLYVCGCCPDSCPCDGCWMPMGMTWTMKQDESDENKWDRDIYLYCSPSKKWSTGSYTLIRIVDENGNKLPGYADMVEQLEKTPADAECGKLRAVYGKPKQQIMNGHDCKGNILFGSGGNPDDYMQLP